MKKRSRLLVKLIYELRSKVKVMENKRDKIALVTGGNRGIGFAIAQRLLQKGYEVIISSRSLHKAQEAAQKL